MNERKQSEYSVINLKFYQFCQLNLGMQWNMFVWCDVCKPKETISQHFP